MRPCERLGSVAAFRSLPFALLTSRLAGARTMLVLATMCLAAAGVRAQTTLTVNTLADSNDALNNCASGGAGTCSLRDAISQANSDGTADTIGFEDSLAGTLTLTGDLPAIQDNGLTINGAGTTLTISGANAFRCFFVGAWKPGTSTQIAVDVTIENLGFSSCRAQGGAGGSGTAASGGGGAGLGGAIFAANLSNVTLSNLSFSANGAVGGVGGTADSSAAVSSEASGGGGMGGSGGAADPTANYGGGSGGGGLGAGANGSSDPVSGVTGIATGAASGGIGDTSCTLTGGPNGGGGAGDIGASFTCGSRSGGGGGVGGGNGHETGSAFAGNLYGIGGSGGFGGGGGGASNLGLAFGGTGGFGGGGGGAANSVSGPGAVPGNGGFGGGGGGGAEYADNGIGGFGGGNGTNGTLTGVGGGGLGAGGAVFVQQGGTLTLSGSLSEAGDTVTAGTGGNNGSAFGSAIFIQGSNTLTFSPGAGQTQTISGVIADQSGSGGTGANAGAGGVTVDGAGTLILSGVNTYTGVTTVISGTLDVNGSLAAGSTVVVENGARLGGTGTINANVVLMGTGSVDTSHGLNIKGGTVSSAGLLLITFEGTPQTTSINQSFVDPLYVELTDGNGTAIRGVQVNFTAPGSGASASLSATSCMTSTSGTCSVSATANGTTGSYTVIAAVSGFGGVGPATFALTNVSPIFIVNNAGDSNTFAGCSTLSSTVTTNSTDPNCNLRAAMAAAGTGGVKDIYFDTTVFSSPRTITLTSANGPLILAPQTISLGEAGTITLGSADPMTIHGPGANLLTISGNNQTGVFSLDAGSGSGDTVNIVPNTVTLSGLTIADGNSTSSGGAISFGLGTLTVNDTVFTGNNAPGGGAIFSFGSLTLTNSTFKSNTSTGTTTTSGTGGGAVLLVDESLGSSPDTGGLVVNLDNNTFSQNTSTGMGGAVASWAVLTSANNNTFNGNISGINGGAMFVDDLGGTPAMTNNTFEGNGASEGGAIFFAGVVPGTASNNIFAGNVSLSGGAGIANTVEDTITSTSTTPSTLNASHNVYYDNVTNSVEDDCNLCTSNTNAVSATSNPIASGLGNFGGPTETYLPEPGSAAICSGSASAAAGAGITTDQRGVALSLTPANVGSYTGAGGYCSSGTLDAGSVQTNYTLSFTTEPEPISPATSIYTQIPFQAAVTLDENGAPIAISGVTIALSPAGDGALGGGSAVTSNGVATYSSLDELTAGNSQLKAVLQLSSADSALISALSSTFDVEASASPAITSANKAAFAMNSPGSFTVTTTGTPTPSISLSSCSGNSISSIGLGFIDNGNGTATLSGAPIAPYGFPGEVTTCTLTASNGVGSNATQNFTVNIESSSVDAVTAISTAALNLGTTFTPFQPVSGSGGTSPYVYTVSPGLPSGLSMISTTGSITGTPAAVSPSTIYTVTVTDNLGSTATSTFTLSVTATNVISFPSLGTQVVFGDAAPPALTATASSGLGVSYAVSGPASILDGSLSMTGPGTVTVTASQAGNGTYPTATPVAQTITVLPANFMAVSSGTQTQGKTSTVTVTLQFNASFTLNSLSVNANGSASIPYVVTSGGTCTVGSPYTPGSSCTVALNYTPGGPGMITGTVEALDTNGLLQAATNAVALRSR